MCMARLAGYHRTGGSRQSVHHGIHLVDAVRNLPEQPITFTIDDKDKSVTIHYLNGHYEAWQGLAAMNIP